MSDLSDRIKSYFPSNGDTGVPLLSNVTVTLSGLDYDEDSLKEGLFLEGPDTDQFIGPGLLELVSPNNISQGELDDFLQSPGYQGIVAGATTVTGIAGDTIVTFNPTLPFAASTNYRVNLTGVLDVSLASIDGFATFSFTTGTGSIQEVPSNISSSVLSAAIAEVESLGLTESFKVLSSDPADMETRVDPNTAEISIEFNKLIDASSVAANVSAKTVPATDHPNATTNEEKDLAIVTVVEGNKLKIKI